jgi:hypothetical protein
MMLYVAPVSAEQQMNVSPEEMKKGMEPWNVGTKNVRKQSSFLEHRWEKEPALAKKEALKVNQKSLGNYHPGKRRGCCESDRCRPVTLVRGKLVQRQFRMNSGCVRFKKSKLFV